MSIRAVSLRFGSVASFCSVLSITNGVAARVNEGPEGSRDAPAHAPATSEASGTEEPTASAAAQTNSTPQSAPPRAASADPPAINAPAQWSTNPSVATRPIGPQLGLDSHAVGPSPSPQTTKAAPAEQPLMGASVSEGIYARSSDGALSLKVGTTLQLRFNASSTTDPSRRVEFVPVLARIYVQGTIGAPWLRFVVQPELAGQQSPEPMAPVPPAPRLLDAWVEAKPSEWIGVRLGMMRPLFSRSWINGLQRAILFDRSDANAFFRNHGPITEVSGSNVEQTLPWDRDIGVSLMGEPLDGVLEYSVGLFNGNGSWFGRNGDQWVMPMARLAVNPLGVLDYDETLALSNPNAEWKFQLAVGAYENRYRVDYLNPGFDMDGTEEQRTLEADITMAGTGVYLSAEGYLRSRRLTNGETNEERGATGLAGWMIWSPHLEVAGRVSYIDPNRETKNDLRRVVDAQLNYYHFGNNLKLALRYSWANNQALIVGGVPGSPAIVGPDASVSTLALLTQVHF
jgi:hypothetical protein